MLLLVLVIPNCTLTAMEATRFPLTLALLRRPNPLLWTPEVTLSGFLALKGTDAMTAISQARKRAAPLPLSCRNRLPLLGFLDVRIPNAGGFTGELPWRNAVPSAGHRSHGIAATRSARRISFSTDLDPPAALHSSRPSSFPGGKYPIFWSAAPSLRSGSLPESPVLDGARFPSRCN